MDFFGRVQERRQALRHFRPSADGAGDGLGEFGGMRRGQDDPLRVAVILLREALPAQHADGGVRIEDVVVLLLDVVHDAQRFLVAEAAAPDVMADGAKIVVVEIDDAREIARISHVHRVGERVAGGARNQVAAAQKFGNHVVRIGRGDELRDRQANALGKQALRSGCRNCRWEPKTPLEHSRILELRRSPQK